MKMVRKQTDAELEGNLKDAVEAIRAMPEGRNVARYLAERDACQEELIRRARVRMHRAGVREFHDPLDSPVRSRGRVRIRNAQDRGTSTSRLWVALDKRDQRSGRRARAAR